MSLTRKVSIIVILVFLVSALASFAIQKIFIMPSFITLEKETAIKNAKRVMGAIDRDLEQVSTLVTDWSHWTDSYNYVKGQNPDYEGDNLDFENTLSALSMNYLAYYDTTGKAIWSRTEDLESGEPVDLGLLTEAQLPVDHPLIQHENLKGDIKGIIPTLSGPLLIVAGPILTSEEEGPVAGTLMMGRFLDDNAIERIGDLTQLSIATETTNQQKGPSNPIETGVSGYGMIHTALEMVETPKNWQVLTTLTDIFNKPI